MQESLSVILGVKILRFDALLNPVLWHSKVLGSLLYDAQLHRTR